MRAFSIWFYRQWNDPLGRAAILFAGLTVLCGGLMAGNPEFSNATHPWLLGDPILSLELVRNVNDVDMILGNAPSLDRETMRLKTYIDFGFLTGYSGLLVTLGWRLARLARDGSQRRAGTLAAICGVAAGALDIVENLGILNLLDVPLRATTATMLNAIRVPSLGKWTLAFGAIALLSYGFVKYKKAS